ncbi:hypothetical protein [Pseudactinotalea suaedae]|uniref:hypothetical protein n=1 Tax=Pseudactinotalea suaedae TaxID=1524924 RepID=UPI0012E1FB76|nr:hypothetical protein [Pseudactinotalea suaedae]
MPAARRLGPVEITLIVIDVILIGVLIVLLATAPDGPDDGAGGPTTTTSAPSDPATDETTSGTSTQAVTAPADALDVAEFATPSGNIWCTIGDSAAVCQIDVIDYQPPQIEGCADNELAGKIVQVSAEGAEYPCPTENIPGAAAADRTVLDYDQTTAVGDYMCASSETGVTCTNLSAGHRFTITRYGPSLD